MFPNLKNIYIDKPTRSVCEDGHFHCNNGKCILKSWLCNGWDECGDSSDEQNCTGNNLSQPKISFHSFIHSIFFKLLQCPARPVTLIVVPTVRSAMILFMGDATGFSTAPAERTSKHVVSYCFTCFVSK